MESRGSRRTTCATSCSTPPAPPCHRAGKEAPRPHRRSARPLPPRAPRLRQHVLRHRGLRVEETLRAGAPRPGDWGLMIALGPASPPRARCCVVACRSGRRWRGRRGPASCSTARCRFAISPAASATWRRLNGIFGGASSRFATCGISSRDTRRTGRSRARTGTGSATFRGRSSAGPAAPAVAPGDRARSRRGHAVAGAPGHRWLSGDHFGARRRPRAALPARHGGRGHSALTPAPSRAAAAAACLAAMDEWRGRAWW